jgi:hypothetical protein
LTDIWQLPGPFWEIFRLIEACGQRQLSITRTSLTRRPVDVAVHARARLAAVDGASEAAEGDLDELADLRAVAPPFRASEPQRAPLSRARRELSAANQGLATDTAAFERCRQPVNRLRSLMAVLSLTQPRIGSRSGSGTMHRAIVSNRLMGSGSEQELPSPGYRQTSPGTADESLAPFPGRRRSSC